MSKQDGIRFPFENFANPLPSGRQPSRDDWQQIGKGHVVEFHRHNGHHTLNRGMERKVRNSVGETITGQCFHNLPAVQVVTFRGIAARRRHTIDAGCYQVPTRRVVAPKKRRNQRICHPPLETLVCYPHTSATEAGL